MSRDDPVRPTHATGEEYADALSGLIEPKKSADSGRSVGQASPKKSSESNPFHIFLLVAALSGLVGWNAYYLTRPVEPGTPELQRRAASVKLYHTVQAIEAHRSRTGALPEDLSSLNVPLGEYEYVRADTGYTVALRTADTYNQYRSGGDPQELVRRAGITGGGGAATGPDSAAGADTESGEGNGATEGTQGG